MLEMEDMSTFNEKSFPSFYVCVTPQTHTLGLTMLLGADCLCLNKNKQIEMRKGIQIFLLINATDWLKKKWEHFQYAYSFI